jgi:hypothetical protein
MKTFLRRLRGIVGIGLTWSAVWAVTGIFFGTVQFVSMSRAYPELARLSTFAIMALASGVSWATYGFALGSIFGGVLAIAERRRTLERLATWRIAVWGAIAGLLLPLSFALGMKIIEGVSIDNVLVATAISASLGAGCAAGSLLLARASGAGPNTLSAGGREQVLP